MRISNLLSIGGVKDDPAIFTDATRVLTIRDEGDGAATTTRSRQFGLQVVGRCLCLDGLQRRVGHAKLSEIRMIFKD